MQQPQALMDGICTISTNRRNTSVCWWSSSNVRYGRLLVADPSSHRSVVSSHKSCAFVSVSNSSVRTVCVPLRGRVFMAFPFFKVNTSLSFICYHWSRTFPTTQCARVAVIRTRKRGAEGAVAKAADRKSS